MTATTFHTDVPGRLDRLPWTRFHTLIVTALGITWVLDGLEVTLVGSLSDALRHSSLGLSAAEVGLTASAYLAGAVIGALLFGDLADRYGRKTLFLVTLGVYLVATIATGFAWNFASFVVFRAITGAGIGGEYSAINSAIQEFVPARYRGRTDLAVNGSWWLGTALGALGSLVVLDPHLVPPEIGWRLAFIIGGVLAIGVIFLRRFVPESPRWLMTHGRPDEALRVAREIEARAGVSFPDEAGTIALVARGRATMVEVIAALFTTYPKRTALGLTLMATQAFCYNAIFFTYAMMLTAFFAVPGSAVGWFILPFAAGNFLGPLVLGPLFDTLGRKTMIASTYAVAGILLALSGWAFSLGLLGAVTQTIAWCVIFFFASAGASAAYLTVGEAFPLELRARAIAIFYAFGTALGGIAGPAVFGALIDTGARVNIFYGYLFGGSLMLIAAVVELAIGIKAEGKSLEAVAPPLGLA